MYAAVLGVENKTGRAGKCRSTLPLFCCEMMSIVYECLTMKTKTANIKLH
jgi:hypothetical protein